MYLGVKINKYHVEVGVAGEQEAIRFLEGLVELFKEAGIETTYAALMEVMKETGATWVSGPKPSVN